MLFFIVTLFVILFAKEFIVINEELMVIFGFLTIFSLIKMMLTPVLVEAFATYSENIRNTYVITLKQQLDENKNISTVNSMHVDIKNHLMVYYRYLLGYSIMFFDSLTMGNLVATLETIKISLNIIINNIKRMIRGKN